MSCRRTIGCCQVMKNKTDSLLGMYLDSYANLAPDPLCPEILVYNTHSLNGLWKFTCGINGKQNSEIPFWGIIWPGGRALARYVLDNPEFFHGIRVLDLGTGSGIGAIAAAMTGAIVTGIDVDSSAIELAERTADLNHVKCRFQFADPLLLKDVSNDYDIIIAGDVFYEECFAAGVVSFLRKMAVRGLDNIVADIGRTYMPRTGIKMLQSMRIPVLREIEGISRRDADVFSVLA